MLLSAFLTLISRLVGDHLPGGKYHNPSAKLITETKSVPIQLMLLVRETLESL